MLFGSDATGIIGIARVGRSISQIQNVAEFSKLAIVAHRQEDRHGAGMIQLIGRNVWMRVAGLTRHFVDIKAFAACGWRMPNALS